MNSTVNPEFNDRNDVTYTLTTQGAAYENEAIEASLIVDIMAGFEQEPDDFIVIEPNIPIGGSVYLQAAPSPEADGGISVELRLERNDGTFNHYSYSTTDKDEAIRMLLDYWGIQKLPDLTEWTDIADQF
ncbi:hypothetical protein SAMN05216312_104573 [Cohnella sp. OV330]|uniref:hypothetical protein n=1 Tax=Cohnella sp. OV330 TaxID=1855288 RepID=UPI0008E380C7|nr:hypothetical protein [Cohnella sp. OV330]SFB22653.1 hypothetical protein SAMN05216312_104573 [Cohnella sp. OV330]